MASLKTCGHDEFFRVALSGTQVRTILRNGSRLPPEFTRPEVGEVLRKAFHDLSS